MRMLRTVVLLLPALIGYSAAGCGSGLDPVDACYCVWEYDVWGDLVYNCYYCKDDMQKPDAPEGYVVIQREDGKFVATPSPLW